MRLEQPFMHTAVRQATPPVGLTLQLRTVTRRAVLRVHLCADCDPRGVAWISTRIIAGRRLPVVASRHQCAQHQNQDPSHGQTTLMNRLISFGEQADREHHKLPRRQFL